MCRGISSLNRKNENIHGIQINSKEYLLSQYADDTSLTLEATESSLKHTLNVLKFYALASGLQVNVEKTKVIWIGSMKGSNYQICRDFNLCWEKGTFTVLGVKFSVNLNDMVKINYDEKLREIKFLLIQWSKRILTPYGRITVIKSLAMAKINHLLLALPNPSENVVKELNSLFFKYIWNGSVDRVKRDITTKDYKQGGLKMIRIEFFIKSLKISWIRRIFQKDSKWLHLLQSSYPILKDFSHFGTDFLQSKIKNIDNKFWYDTVSAWIQYTNKFKPNTWSNFLKEPVWYNNLLKVGGKTIFYKKWFLKGVHFVNDFFNENGTFKVIDYFINTLNIETNFVEFQGLKRTINDARNHLFIKIHEIMIEQPFRPCAIETLLLDKRGCQRIYRILSHKDSLPTAQLKWINNNIFTEQTDWNRIYSLTYNTTKDTKLRWFQFRLIHRILSTNMYLHKIGLAQDNTCTFCRNNPESLIHLFGDCPISRNFWQDLETWLKGECVHVTNL